MARSSTGGTEFPDGSRCSSEVAVLVPSLALSLLVSPTSLAPAPSVELLAELWRGPDSLQLDEEEAPLELTMAPPSPLELHRRAPSPCSLALDGILGFPAFEGPGSGAPRPTIARNGHYDRRGEWVEYQQIARRPGRPEGYEAYLLPVSTEAWVASGYDLDKPDEEQRRGPHLSQVGHGGVDLADHRGTPIRMITLEHQVGGAEVLYVGHLFGNSVITRHTIREGGRLHDYVLIFGHLEGAAEGLRRGSDIAAGDLVGTMGDSDSPELVHLHLEARRMRDGVDAWTVPGPALNARDVSVVVDPRNVLSLRAPAWRKPCVMELAAPWRPADNAFPRLELEMSGEPLTIP